MQPSITSQETLIGGLVWESTTTRDRIYFRSMRITLCRLKLSWGLLYIDQTHRYCLKYRATGNEVPVTNELLSK